MSGKKDSFHVDMAGVASLGRRKDRPAGSKSARRGGALASKSAIDRRSPRGGK